MVIKTHALDSDELPPLQYNAASRGYRVLLRAENTPPTGYDVSLTFLTNTPNEAVRQATDLYPNLRVASVTPDD